MIDTAGGFHYADGGISFFKWILSPLLVLGAEGNGALIAIIAFFLLAIGCGFASGVLDPFTVGVAQELAGLLPGDSDSPEPGLPTVANGNSLQLNFFDF